MIKTIYSNRENFIIIGLTGRIGSGCTTAAKFLAQTKKEHNLKDLCLSEVSDDSYRKKYIINQFYKQKWNPFTMIRAADIITLFMIQHDFEAINSKLKDLESSRKSIDGTKDKNDLNSEKSRLGSCDELEGFSDDFKKTYSKAYNKLSKLIKSELFKNYRTLSAEDLYNLLSKDLVNIANEIKKNLMRHSYKNYTDIFQLFGDNIRLCGDVFFTKSNKDPKNIFKISECINKIIKIIREHNSNLKKPTFIVIDAIRNPLEAMYFKERFSAFYLFSISAQNKDIETRLLSRGDMTKKNIEHQSSKEHQKKSLDSLENFVSQNIPACITKSDVFIVNNGSDNDDYRELYGQIIKYVSLIMHPGLITPSLDEKMMEVAYTAKLNSGCLSRQVGAAVTNKYDSLKSIGWNSVAEGQTPCLLRNSNELLSKTKSSSYSLYEKSKEFREFLSKESKVPDDRGLNPSFCFKTIYTKNKEEEKGNQVHTRSLHAEENAFLQLAKYGSEGIKGGTLYSTASPCELCSKKAYQLGIQRIVYIDPYPGIAINQILLTGQASIKIELFKGAIGIAYHKLYEQIIPYKDELTAIIKKVN